MLAVIQLVEGVPQDGGELAAARIEPCERSAASIAPRSIASYGGSSAPGSGGGAVPLEQLADAAFGALAAGFPENCALRELNPAQNSPNRKDDNR